MRFGDGGAELSMTMPEVATLPALSVAVTTWSDSGVSGTMNLWLKLPLALVVSGLSAGLGMAISSYLMETWLVEAKPLPVTVTSLSISGSSGSRIVLGLTWRLALTSPMDMFSSIVLNSCWPEMVSGMVN